MFRNVMKAAIFTTITGTVTVRPPKEHTSFPTYFPLFKYGKLVQLKHCITKLVVLNLGTELSCREVNLCLFLSIDSWCNNIFQQIKK